jgi:TPP-dependent pyruvate/acetoin dehydrogenase alpha subunit
MADSKHTPGPWSASWSNYRERVFIVKAGMPSNRVLAEFDGDGDGPDDQSIADAHLIAAAPDLLSALKAVLPILSAARLQVGFGKTQMDRIAKAEAAITKAGG